MSSPLRELRLACRRLAARLVLVVVAVVSVGLGIGVNAAVYSLFNAVFLQAPTAVGITTALFLTAAVAAAYRPARQAGHAQPVDELR